MELLTFVLDDHGDEPLYHQLYSHIKREIQEGRIDHDDKLPSKRKLADHLGVSQNTVTTAYEQLIDEGYVRSIERKGYFVEKIDNLLIYDEPKEQIIASKDLVDESIKYDFSYEGVDRQSFPFYTWGKITREIINECDTELLKETESQGDYNLRQSIADYLRQSRGVICSADDIILSSGAEYLFYILFQLFDSEKIYGIENPGYEKLPFLFSSNRVKYIPIDIDENGMTLEGVEESQADIICITPAHQFPTGSIMPISRRVQLLNWMNAKSDRYIVEDDYDSEFKYSGRPIPALKGLKNSNRVIYMGNFSKSLSPGLRVSYMVMPEELMQRYRRDMPFMLCPIPTIEQRVLTEFMEGGYFARHLNRMRNTYRKKRETLVGCISQHEDKFEVIGADAGLHITVEVDNGMTERELVESAAAQGVKVYGLSSYCSRERDINRILLGYANITEEEIEEGIELLFRAWMG